MKLLNWTHKDHPFGMQMPGRNFSSDEYRYGFNGMEKDDEVKGSGNSLDFGARIYDSRIAKFLSLDPLATTFPNLSPYSYAANNPIFYIDKEGKHRITYYTVMTDQGTAKFKTVNYNNETEIDWESTYGGGFSPRYTNPVTFVTLDLRTNIPEAENLTSTREGSDEEGETISSTEFWSQRNDYIENLFKGPGGGEIEGGVAWTSSKGEGPGVKSNNKAIVYDNIDDFLGAMPGGTFGPISSSNKVGKVLEVFKKSMGDFGFGQQLAESFSNAYKEANKLRSVPDQRYILCPRCLDRGDSIIIDQYKNDQHQIKKSYEEKDKGNLKNYEEKQD